MTTANGSEAVVVDSSGWLEYITGDEKAGLFASYFETDTLVLVPAIVLYEVRKILLLRKLDTLAHWFVSEALRRPVIAIGEDIALCAATISLEYQLSMADAFLYAAARSREAHFVTSDAHFKDLPHVTLV